MSRYLVILFFIFVSFLNAKGLNIDKLEQEIFKNNREGKYQESQQKLSDLLLSEELSDEESGNVLFLMANTYRCVNDLMMSIDYLVKADAIAQTLPKNNVLRMRIDYEFAYVYFDNKDFEKCRLAMKHITDQNYKNAFPEDRSFIFLQEGYLFLRDKEFGEAEKKYINALKIMEKANYCNLPIVMVKMMELYNKEKNLKKVEKIYRQSMKISDSCDILKYKIFVASEMERIYRENNMLHKIGALNLDSLKRQESLDVKVSEMHMMDRNYLEKSKARQNDFFKKNNVIAGSLIVLGIFGFYFYKSRKKFKKDKKEMEAEIFLMKKELNSYSKSSHPEEKFVEEEFSANFNKLTDRQKELLKLMLKGLSNKEIADKLFISESTVKYHVKNIFSILELKDRKDFFRKMNNN